MQLIPFVATFTRTLQKTFPRRPVRGIRRLSHFLIRHSPIYESVVPLNAGFKMRLNSSQDAECSLLFAGTYQPALSHLLTRYAVHGGYYLDVGANLGFFSLLFASWQGHVTAFEASPHMVARIREASQLNGFQIEIVEKAVHDQSGDTVTFYVSATPGKSSIYGENVPQLQEQLQVLTISIDDYVEQVALPRVDIIKMDIEGHDCRGLLGAEKTIRRHRPFIVFEYTQDSEKDAQASLAQLFAELGYTLEILLLNGQRLPFNWHLPANLHHGDVICLPPASKTE